MNDLIIDAAQKLNNIKRAYLNIRNILYYNTGSDSFITEYRTVESLDDIPLEVICNGYFEFEATIYLGGEERDVRVMFRGVNSVTNTYYPKVLSVDIARNNVQEQGVTEHQMPELTREDLEVIWKQ